MDQINVRRWASSLRQFHRSDFQVRFLHYNRNLLTQQISCGESERKKCTAFVIICVCV